MWGGGGCGGDGRLLGVGIGCTHQDAAREPATLTNTPGPVTAARHVNSPPTTHSDRAWGWGSGEGRSPVTAAGCPHPDAAVNPPPSPHPVTAVGCPTPRRVRRPHTQRSPRPPSRNLSCLACACVRILTSQRGGGNTTRLSQWRASGRVVFGWPHRPRPARHHPCASVVLHCLPPPASGQQQAARMVFNPDFREGWRLVVNKGARGKLVLRPSPLSGATTSLVRWRTRRTTPFRVRAPCAGPPTPPPRLGASQRDPTQH